MAKIRKTAPPRAHLTKHHRAVIGRLRAQGAANISATQRRHVRLRFSWLGKTWATTLSSTPTDEDSSTSAAIQQLRHQLGIVGPGARGRA